MKSYTANSMQEAMVQVKSELGRDAVILHTRRFRMGGFLGFFSKEKVEVTAAVDSADLKKVVKKTPALLTEQAEDARMLPLQAELTNMHKMLEAVLTKLPDGEGQASPFLQLLLRNDVALPIANSLLKEISGTQFTAKSDAALTRHLLHERIAHYFSNIEGIQIDSASCRTVALIGPTGVGKTTTIAKIAADFTLKQGSKVALITADTYRIAAVEQLKTYADIIGVPLDIVYSAEELKQAIDRHQDKDLILVDTAGRSPGNLSHLTELQALLAVDPAIETYLVLSMTTKYQDALDIVEKFSVCTPQKLLFTKADESTNIGTLFNLIYRFPMTLSYIATGQDVPDDIELANTDKLTNLLLKE
ncbi:flagellar biosynthesis protein FlhF [Pelorhabdus rhamnosifermentans]|uniref:flagellar biosynthesis protein FlhF n=1 Tax=Pelorhabdus rhamnosifermentans TaxID=2772457 RepID=UPI0028B14667|nr:flagellar biosynthesis protein FlhF [Pelorhabdus rhamnosifermentans]